MVHSNRWEQLVFKQHPRAFPSEPLALKREHKTDASKDAHPDKNGDEADNSYRLCIPVTPANKVPVNSLGNEMGRQRDET